MPHRRPSVIHAQRRSAGVNSPEGLDEPPDSFSNSAFRLVVILPLRYFEAVGVVLDVPVKTGTERLRMVLGGWRPTASEDALTEASNHLSVPIQFGLLESGCGLAFPSRGEILTQDKAWEAASFGGYPGLIP